MSLSAIISKILLTQNRNRPKAFLFLIIGIIFSLGTYGQFCIKSNIILLPLATSTNSIFEMIVGAIGFLLLLLELLLMIIVLIGTIVWMLGYSDKQSLKEFFIGK